MIKSNISFLGRWDYNLDGLLDLVEVTQDGDQGDDISFISIYKQKNHVCTIILVIFHS